MDTEAQEGTARKKTDQKERSGAKREKNTQTSLRSKTPKGKRQEGGCGRGGEGIRQVSPTGLET